MILKIRSILSKSWATGQLFLCTDGSAMTKPRKHKIHYPRFTWLIRGEARMPNDEGMTKPKTRIPLRISVYSCLLVVTASSSNHGCGIGVGLSSEELLSFNFF